MGRALVCLVVLAGVMRGAGAQEDPHVVSGFNHYYNLEYEQALAEFGIAEKSWESDAGIHNDIAQVLLYREMLRNGALETEFISGGNAFLRRPKMNPTPEVTARFDREVARAVEISKAKLAKNANDIDALYTLGVSLGLRSNFNYLVRKAWRESLSDATDARKLHNRVTELDPNNWDARLIQGMHDYIVGSLPWYLRGVGFLVGFHGDREGGLKMLETVAQKGKQNKVDAEILLCALYRREGLPNKALPLLEDLLKRFPRDYLLMFEKAEMYSDLGDKDSALKTVAQLSEMKQKNTNGYSRVPWDRIYYAEGNIEFWYNDLDQALANLKKVTAQTKDLDLNVGVLAFLRQGQIYDMTNRHDLARQAYQSAINFAPQAEAAKESKRYMSDPYRRS